MPLKISLKAEKIAQLKGWIGSMVVYSLGGLTPIILELLLEGTVSRISIVAFVIGFWGIFSGGLIYLVKTNVGTMDQKHFDEANQAVQDVNQIAAKQVVTGANSQKALRETVIDVKKQIDEEKTEDATHIENTIEEVPPVAEEVPPVEEISVDPEPEPIPAPVVEPTPEVATETTPIEAPITDSTDTTPPEV